MNLKTFRPNRILAGALAAMLSVSIGFAGAPSVSAAEVPDATIHTDQLCSITLYKYDITQAEKDGIWNSGSYVSTGRYDENVNSILGNAVRKGASSNASSLGNGESSTGYAIKGCEFTYMRVADVYQYSQPNGEDPAAAGVEVLYAFNKAASADLLSAIGLPNGAKSNEAANALPGNENSWYYRSDTINKALEESLVSNATTVKNALEAYVQDGGTAMPLTDGSGKSSASGLDVGLYVLVETKVPEMVTSTTSPFFVSLPSTSVNGGGNGSGSNTTEITNGGQEWMYDLTLYPKNQTGIVTLAKEVRESKQDGGKHGGTDQIDDGFTSSTTASTGDVLDYQILSTLPTITSAATRITTYNFFDTISAGLTYNKEAKDVRIDVYTDKGCTDHVTSWDMDSGKFDVIYSEDGRTMTVDITQAGLDEINGSEANANGSLYTSYSNYTLRVSYTAILNENAATIVGGEGNDNKVILTWKRSSTDYYDTLIDDAHVFCFGLELQKQFSDLDDKAAAEKNLFASVKFKIFNATDNAWITAALNEAEGIYYMNGNAAEEKDATIFNPQTVAGVPGQLLIRGLEDDEYVLTEVETADGYTLLKDNIKVKITTSDDPSRPCNIYAEDVLGVIQNDPRYQFDGGLNLHLANVPQAPLAHNLLIGSATVDGNKTTMAPDREADHALATMTVVNSRGFDLPQTGDNGTTLIPIAGAVFVAGALVLSGSVYLIMRKRKDNTI